MDGRDDDPDATGTIGGPLRRLPAATLRDGLATALSLYARLSAENAPGRRAVLEFNARAFERDGARAVPVPRVLERAEVDAFCPRLGEVEARAERAVAAIRAEGRDLPPALFGTAANVRLRDDVNGLVDLNFRSEESFEKIREIDRSSGQRGNIRVDVIERVSDSTVCVYDLKTGTSGLTAARFREIGETVRRHHPTATRTIVTEIRVPR